MARSIETPRVTLTGVLIGTPVSYLNIDHISFLCYTQRELKGNKSHKKRTFQNSIQ